MPMTNLKTAAQRFALSFVSLNRSLLTAQAPKLQRIQSTVAAWMALMFIFLSPTALADAGHDHKAADSKVSSAALSRFAAVSEEFELVGIVEGKRITLYLDRFADNTPVRHAQIELGLAGSKYIAEKHDEDTYEITLQEVLPAGLIPVTATVNTGDITEHLATELDIHSDGHAAISGFAWKTTALWTGAALLCLLALAAARRLRTPGRRV